MCRFHMIWGFRALFPQFPSCLNTHKAGTTEPRDHFGIKVTPHLMLIVELKTLDHFLCVPACDLECLGPVSPNYPNT